MGITCPFAIGLATSGDENFRLRPNKMRAGVFVSGGA